MIGRAIALVMGSPAAAQGVLWAVVGLAVAGLGLTTWAYSERSGRFQCEAGAAALAADNRVLEAQVKVLAGELARQNLAEQQMAKLGAQITGDVKGLIAAAKAGSKARDADAAASEAKLNTPASQDCGKAWREIRLQKGVMR